MREKIMVFKSGGVWITRLPRIGFVGPQATSYATWQEAIDVALQEADLARATRSLSASTSTDGGWQPWTLRSPRV